MIYKRTLASTLKKLGTSYKVTFLTGPRQSGKTTLARNTFPDFEYATLESLDIRQQARDDPRAFLSTAMGSQGFIIDEAQNVPDLFSYIQEYVDIHEVGPIVLTGSQHFLLSEKITQSLAGRASVLELLPLSVSELAQIKGRTPNNILKEIDRKVALSRDEVLFNGLFPEIYARNLGANSWYRSYVQTYIERDVRSVLNVGDLDTFQRFLMLCAGRSGQILNLSSLSSDCGISQTTARKWLSVLEASYIASTVRPHHRNFSKRVVKRSKLYLNDCGLMCHLLGIRKKEEIKTHPLRGAIFETFVASELKKIFYNAGERPPIYFWRDNHGDEIDFLLDFGKELIPIEVKSGETVTGDFFRSLEKYKRLSGCKQSVLIYGGDKSSQRRDTSIWPWYGCS